MDERTRKMVAEFRAGSTQREIAQRWGLSRARISQLLGAGRVSRREGGAARRAELRYDAIEAERARAAEERRAEFWRMVDRSGGPASCWPWLGRVQPSGHGRCSVRVARSPYAHRTAYLLTYGAPTVSQLHRGAAVIRHTCDNPPCCNPAHLLAGTQADNVRDRDARGRDRFSRGLGPVRPAGFHHDEKTKAKMRDAQAKWKGQPSRAASWWAGLSEAEREAHRQKSRDAARAAIAQDPAAFAAKISAGRKKPHLVLGAATPRGV